MSHGSTDVLQDDIPRLPLQLDAAAPWHIHKAVLDLPDNALGPSFRQGIELFREVVMPVCLPHKIEHRKALLARGKAQASAQLL